MNPETSLMETATAMDKAVEYLSHEFAGVRTGKASPGLVENLDVHVHAYNSTMKLKALAVISTPEPRMIMIQPFDPSTTQDIERAIRESKLGLNPAAADRSIRLPIPELSEERRRDLVKMVKHMAEEARVRIRACRKEGMDDAKTMLADKALTEDGKHDYEIDIQELTDKHIKRIDEILVVKEEEIMKV